MGWKWNDALGGAIDGLLSYGPYGAVYGGAIGGWSKDFNKGLTGDSRSGLVEKTYGTKGGNIGTKLAGNFSGDERDQQFTEDGKFDLGKSLGNVANMYSSYMSSRGGGSGSGGGGISFGGSGSSGGSDYSGIISGLLNSFGGSNDDDELPSNAGISFGDSDSEFNFTSDKSSGGSGNGTNYGQLASIGAGLASKFLSNKDRVSQNEANNLDENGSPIKKSSNDSIFSGEILSKVFDLLGKQSGTTEEGETKETESETGETDDFSKLLPNRSLPITSPLLGFKNKPSLSERLRGSLIARRGY